jgi:hypothetical protein
LDQSKHPSGTPDLLIHCEQPRTVVVVALFVVVVFVDVVVVLLVVVELVVVVVVVVDVSSGMSPSST